MKNPVPGCLPEHTTRYYTFNGLNLDTEAVCSSSVHRDSVNDNMFGCSCVLHV